MRTEIITPKPEPFSHTAELRVTRRDGTTYTKVVTLRIDIAGLMQDVGGKAARNKSRKSIEASGSIVAKSN